MAVLAHISLRPGEEIVRVYRRFPLVDFFKYFFAALFLVLPFFFLFPLLRMGALGVTLGVVVLSVGCAILARTLFIWYHNAFVITTDRIIDFDQRGFFDRVISETSYEKVDDVAIRYHGIAQTLFRYGSLSIWTAQGTVVIVVPQVYRPIRAQRLLLDLQRSYDADALKERSKQDVVYVESDES